MSDPGLLRVELGVEGSQCPDDMGRGDSVPGLEYYQWSPSLTIIKQVSLPSSQFFDVSLSVYGRKILRKYFISPST